MKFELFDPDGELRITAGNLPHWYQPGVTYFVTMRTDDSVPQSVAALWHARRCDWLRRHAIDPCDPGAQWAILRLPAEQRREYQRMFTQRFQEYLDRGHGRCPFKRVELAQVVADSLLHFDGDRYHIGDLVVMPNHVHLLVCLLGDTEIERQCHDWKQFTAVRINRALGRRGRFWQEESFDHLVRSADEFEYFERYIAENPTKARLREGQFIYRRRSE